MITEPDLLLPWSECTSTLSPCSMASSMKLYIILIALFFLSKIYPIEHNVHWFPSRSNWLTNTECRIASTSWGCASPLCWLYEWLCCWQWNPYPIVRGPLGTLAASSSPMYKASFIRTGPDMKSTWVFAAERAKLGVIILYNLIIQSPIHHFLWYHTKFICNFSRKLGSGFLLVVPRYFARQIFMSFIKGNFYLLSEFLKICFWLYLSIFKDFEFLALHFVEKRTIHSRCLHFFHFLVIGVSHYVLKQTIFAFIMPKLPPLITKLGLKGLMSLAALFLSGTSTSLGGCPKRKEWLDSLCY